MGWGDACSFAWVAADDWGMRSHWAAAAAAFWAGAWAAAAGLLLLGRCCWAAWAAAAWAAWAAPLTMTVALRQPGHLAGQPGECESVHVWLVTATAPRLAGSAAARGPPAAGGQHLTTQLPFCSPTARGSRKRPRRAVRRLALDGLVPVDSWAI
jgi:hypothetical protein